MHGQGNKSYLLILTLFNNIFVGKDFYCDGSRYKGEYKDGKKHGQGKKSDLLNDLLILTLFNNIFVGKLF